MSHERPQMRATTILAVILNGQLALAGDGQVTYGDMVLKHNAVKIRTLFNGQILAGFAGAVADALTLFDRFEAQLEQYNGNLRRAAVELAKQWRTDKFLRPLEAQLIVGDAEQLLIVSGEGEVIEPDGGIVAIGSGSEFALSAAQALADHTEMTAEQIVEAAMGIAAKLCIYTNDNITIRTIGPAEAEEA